MGCQFRRAWERGAHGNEAHGNEYSKLPQNRASARRASVAAKPDLAEVCGKRLEQADPAELRVTSGRPAGSAF